MFTRNPLHRVTAGIALAALLQSSTPPGVACGPFFRRQYLAQGGMSLLETPRFFAEIELKLLAREYPTPFHAVRDELPQERTRERDIEDFDAAITSGAIHPPDPEGARAAHGRMRETLRQTAALSAEDLAALPPGIFDEVRKNIFPSEFADYHEGVLAFSLGRHAEARAIWERLLARPAAERRYRSVPAAFMIGILGVAEGWEDAGAWLERARAMAQEGFHDESGLAAASYLRQSTWHADRGEWHAAAECALRSISSGYPTTEGLRPKDDTPAELAKFATDPLLRNIYTILLLAGQTRSDFSDPPSKEPLEKWLQALEASGVKEFSGAERVGWLCYASGDYRGARRWVARAPRYAPDALWLTGKLAARDGRREDALRAFSAATRQLARDPEPPLEVTRINVDENKPANRLAAEHAIAAIGAAEFRTALEAFLRGGHWVDAAYVAERLLTVEQLRDFVSRRPWQDAWSDESVRDPWANDGDLLPLQQTENLRWLLARRLARAGRCLEARPYFPPRWRVALDRYTQALAAGKDRRGTTESRANALWQAALEARYHGIELLGTEVAPDWFAREGNFEEDDPAAYRRGMQKVEIDRYSSEAKVVPLPAVLKANAAERARLRSSTTSPGKRFHYRYRAATIAWNAADQLPDNDPRLAAMLNLTGRWLAARDPEAADRFYQALESRCYATALGSRAIARHWFVDVTDLAVSNRPALLPGETP